MLALPRRCTRLLRHVRPYHGGQRRASPLYSVLLPGAHAPRGGARDREAGPSAIEPARGRATAAGPRCPRNRRGLRCAVRAPGSDSSAATPRTRHATQIAPCRRTPLGVTSSTVRLVAFRVSAHHLDGDGSAVRIRNAHGADCSTRTSHPPQLGNRFGDRQGAFRLREPNGLPRVGLRLARGRQGPIRLLLLVVAGDAQGGPGSADHAAPSDGSWRALAITLRALPWVCRADQNQRPPCIPTRQWRGQVTTRAHRK